jgi:DNA-binding PadR family transcriptional regulator
MLSREPMHGHQVLREAELRDVTEWAGISPGSLYGVIGRLEDEGLIAAVRTEQEGRRPARTVYGITDEGRKELGILLEGALQRFDLELGLFDVALLVAKPTVEPGQLNDLVARRAARVRMVLDSLVADRAHLKERKLLGAVEETLMRHAELRLEAEQRWHAELAEQLAERAGRPRLVKGG